MIKHKGVSIERFWKTFLIFYRDERKIHSSCLWAILYEDVIFRTTATIVQHEATSFKAKANMLRVINLKERKKLGH
jgi:hypothetical protein